MAIWMGMMPATVAAMINWKFHQQVPNKRGFGSAHIDGLKEWLPQQVGWLINHEIRIARSAMVPLAPRSVRVKITKKDALRALGYETHAQAHEVVGNREYGSWLAIGGRPNRMLAGKSLSGQ
jgi:hypothetical protein